MKFTGRNNLRQNQIRAKKSKTHDIGAGFERYVKAVEKRSKNRKIFIFNK